MCALQWKEVQDIYRTTRDMLSFFKSESKAITIPDRPPPPSYEQIKEDVEATPDNDIMFRSRLRK